MSSHRIHITTDLEDVIRTEMEACENRLDESDDENDFWALKSRIETLAWVLKQAKVNE